MHAYRCLWMSLHASHWCRVYNASQLVPATQSECREVLLIQIRKHHSQWSLFGSCTKECITTGMHNELGPYSFMPADSLFLCRW